jgi:hypothetical protein
VNEIKVYAERRNFGRDFSIWLIKMQGEGYDQQATPVVWAPLPPNTVVDEPCLTMNEKSAQALMDQLWSTGLRPTEGTGSAGSLAATQAHLQDMRAIVFDMEKPK